jgi:hypothetical protein
MQTKKYNNGQRPSPPIPKTGPNLQRTIKAILGCQKTNGINPRSAIRPQQLFDLILLGRVNKALLGECILQQACGKRILCCFSNEKAVTLQKILYFPGHKTQLLISACKDPVFFQQITKIKIYSSFFF